jgi:arabinofuranan 3-O-arabinosyltransferase
VLQLPEERLPAPPRAPHPAGAGAGAAAGAGPRTRSRADLARLGHPLPAGLLLFGLAFLQSPGNLTFDTKLDLTVDPYRFLAAALQVWNPHLGFGQVQDQNYGYLLPMGAFFALGRLLALPGWIVERAWTGAVLVTAFSGLYLLATRLRTGTRATRVVGALAYALSPIVMTDLGPVSAELLGYALAPWAVVPLVTGMAGGVPPRRAAMRSGAAILLMGGINAAVTLAVLPLPLLWLVTRPRCVRRARLLRWWCLAATLACLWWFLPLLVFARYSVPFNDYIESAVNTTGPTSLFTVLRGADNWLGYLDLGGTPWWRAAYRVGTSVLPVLATTAVAGGGLAGLARRGRGADAQRGFLLLTLLTGLVCVTFGHVGPLAAPWAGAERGLLDGALSPFRNVHKFDALVRVPLALGLVQLLGALPSNPHIPRLGPWRVRATGSLLTLAAVAAGALPLAGGTLLTSGSFGRIPAYWQQTADYLDAHAGRGTALLLPASSTGEYTWGTTDDEPLQWLATASWAVRDQIPFGDTGNTEMLDAVSAVVATGHGSTALAPYLARNGIGYLVVRDDLDWAATDAVRPSLVRASLQASPGISLAASFGPDTTGVIAPAPSLGPTVSDGGLDPAAPSVLVYRVDPQPSAVAAYPVSSAVTASGDSAAVLSLLQAGLLDPATGVLVAGQNARTASGSSVVTDTNRKQETAFGADGTDRSATLAAGQPWSLPRAYHQLDPGGTEQTLARYYGIASVTASSSGSDPLAYYLGGPGHLPYAALDQDPDTFWDSSNSGSAQGQWLQLGLDAPTPVDRVRLTLVDSELLGAEPTAITVTTDTGSVTTPVVPGGGAQWFPARGGPTTRVRVTVAAVQGTGLVGISSLVVPGVTAQRSLVAPDPGTGTAPQSYLFTRSVLGGTGCATVDPPTPVCSPDLVGQSEELGALDRTFTADTTQAVTLRGTLLGVTGQATGLLLHSPGTVAVTASSTLTPDPADRPEAAFDGSAATAWTASYFDPAPSLTFSWTGRRTLSSLRLLTTPDASAPEQLRISSAAGVRLVTLAQGGSGTATFSPLTTDSVTVTFPQVQPTTTVDAATGAPLTLPVGVAELDFPALSGLQDTVRPQQPIGYRCGAGPEVLLDGRSLPTQVSGTVADLLDGTGLSWQTCGPDATVTLARGTHRLRIADGALFAAQSADLVPTTSGPWAGDRGTRVLSASGSTLRVGVGAGAASYLTIDQNANAGWAATLDGHSLAPVTVDGWRQAFLVPAGSGGTVLIGFAPQREFTLALVLGAAAVLALLLLLAPTPRRLRRRRAGPDPEPASGPPTVAQPPRALRAAAGVLLVVLAGPAALIAAAVVFAPRLRAVPWLVGGLFLLAGGVVAEGLRQGAGMSAGGTAAATVITLAALGGVLRVLRTATGTRTGPGTAHPPLPKGPPPDVS